MQYVVCIVFIGRGFYYNNKYLLEYPYLKPGLTPVPHSVDARKPAFTCLSNLEEDDTLRNSATSSDDSDGDMSYESFCHICFLLLLAYLTRMKEVI